MTERASIPKITIVSVFTAWDMFYDADEYMRFKVKGADPDLSKATYRIEDEDHTLGNALRWMLMKKFVTDISVYS
jgi:hypothetical protein